jgi:hypothetical protein
MLRATTLDDNRGESTKQGRKKKNTKKSHEPLTLINSPIIANRGRKKKSPRKLGATTSNDYRGESTNHGRKAKKTKKSHDDVFFSLTAGGGLLSDLNDGNSKQSSSSQGFTNDFLVSYLRNVNNMI